MPAGKTRAKPAPSDRKTRKKSRVQERTQGSKKAVGLARRFSGSRLREIMLPASILLIVGFLAYSNSFTGVFVWDDTTAIVENPNIRALLPLSRSMSSPADVTVAGRPVAALTLALNYALAPLEVRDVWQPSGPGAPADARARFYRNVWGYHFLNLAIHLLAALVLFGVVRRTLLSGPLRVRFGTDAGALAFLIALLWVVHPLHTEAVTYVVQRVESLMGLFYLLTLYCSIRALEQQKGKGFWTTAAIFSCALGMGSKEVMATAPVIVWLWSYLFGEHARRARRWPLHGGLAATWAILFELVTSQARAHSVGFDLGGWTWWNYLQTQAGVVFHYLRLAMAPRPLVFDYAWPRAGSIAEIAPQALALVALVVLTLVALVRRRPAAFLGAWFFAILAPTSSVLPIATEVAAEHRMYLPVAAVLALVVLVVYRLGRGSDLKAALGSAPMRRTAGVAGLVAALMAAGVLAGMTHARNRDYRSVEALLGDTVRKRPLNARARVGYGADLLAEQRYAEAESQLRIAVGLPAGRVVIAQAHMYLGSALCAQGRSDEGTSHYQQALGLDPSLHEINGLLGEVYAGQGELKLAVDYFTKLLETVPDNPYVIDRVARLLATSPRDDVRDGARAVVLAENAVRLSGRRDVISLDTLAAAYAEQERFADALATAREALALARAQGNRDFIAELEQHIALYQSRRKLRQTWR